MFDFPPFLQSIFVTFFSLTERHSVTPLIRLLVLLCVNTVCSVQISQGPKKWGMKSKRNNVHLVEVRLSNLGRNFEFLSVEILCRNFEIISWNFKILSRNFELLTKNFELFSRNFELSNRNFDIISRNLEIPINRNKSICGPNALS